jgi:acyl-CoA synthetase (AMP-forming)/AMP-acid ligase II
MNKSIDKERIGFIKGKHIHNNVISFLEAHGSAQAAKIALKWVSKKSEQNNTSASAIKYDSITYGELLDKVCRLAGGLKELGIKKNDKIVIFLPVSLNLYLSMFAVQRLGAVAVFLDAWSRNNHLKACADIAQPRGMISFKKAFELSKQVKKLDDLPYKIIAEESEKGYSAHLKELISKGKSSLTEAVEPEDTALITFTTGSSGVPKGANRTHGFLAAQHRALDTVISYRKNDIDLPAFPIFLLNNLAGGITTVLPDINEGFKPEENISRLIRQLLSGDVSCATVSPSVFLNMGLYCCNKGIRFSGLRRIVTGGAPVSKRSVKVFREIAPKSRIMIIYGSTEVEPIACIDGDKMLGYQLDNKGVNVGKILPDLECRIIKITKDNIDLKNNDLSSWQQPSGKPGEIIVSGPHVCKNYYNDPGAFKKTKIKENDGTVWHRTGDVGYMDENDNLWLVGRVHNMITRKNEQLFPVEAELTLKSLDFVRQAAFLGLPDEALGEKAVAVISLAKKADRNKKDYYIQDAKENLLKKQIPVDELKIVDEIPLDARHHSKVEYNKLKEMIL